jgi:hypothetical protein
MEEEEEEVGLLIWREPARLASEREREGGGERERETELGLRLVGRHDS